MNIKSQAVIVVTEFTDRRLEFRSDNNSKSQASKIADAMVKLTMAVIEARQDDSLFPPPPPESARKRRSKSRNDPPRK